MKEASVVERAQDQSAVGRAAYAGLFLVTLATLMEEILLTRIFSVTMWYHYAFVAVSIAMFGMTMGALLVYLYPGYFTPARARDQLAQSSLWFSLTVVISFLTHLSIPFMTDRSVVAAYSVALTYAIIAIPFAFSGICVCLALTRFPRQVSKLYAADLAGAAAGCALLIGVLRITDGPTAVIVVAFIAGAGSVFFAAHARRRRQFRVALLITVLLGVAAAGHTVLVQRQTPLLRLVWVKQQHEAPARYEKWNSFSRIRVTGDPKAPMVPWGWGMSPTVPPGTVHRLMLDIDVNAVTPLTEFNGDLRTMGSLKYDITNIAHYLRHDAKVLAVGTGGGRDVLSALVFNQRSVLGVEMNENILDTVNGKYGDFTGHLDRNPRVQFVNDEARSYIARQRDRFDIIQVSLIDTWAATAAGAFVLAENSLYTREAWKVFLSRLTPHGVLTFSRWYYRGRPGEIYRLVALAAAALQDSGVKDPRSHIILVRHLPWRPANWDQPDGVGTILVSPSPFSHQDVAAAEALARRMQFQVVLGPTTAADATLATLASGRDLMGFTSRYPIDITPSSDDRPFFFHMLRFRDTFNRKLLAEHGMKANQRAVSVLGLLLGVVVILTSLCIVVPLLRTMRRETLHGSGPLLLFFASIGLGFMFIEISQMQRLMVFLGHPTYGLSVVLFALLLSSGLGSYLTESLSRRGATRPALVSLLVLLGGLVAFGLLTPYLVRHFQALGTPARILLSVAMLFPLGLLMGMPFPFGMKLASRRSAALTPWLWGVNGATSVCASVLAVVVAMHVGISAAFWVGSACYAVALAAFATAGARGQEPGIRETAPEPAAALVRS